MLDQLLSLNVFAVGLVFTRVGTVLMMLPGISAAYVSVRIRLLLALAVAALLTPVVADTLPGPPNSPADLVVLIGGEVLVGAFLGTIVRIVLAALQIAGTYTSYFVALANAMVHDAIADQQSSTIAGFFGTVGLILVFVTDLHHLMLRALAESYLLFTPGDPLPAGDFAQMVARQVADSVIIGLQMASPFLVVGLTYYIGLGILGRLMPQLPVFFVGLPIQISLQIWVMVLAFSGIMMVFLSYFADVVGPFAGG